MKGQRQENAIHSALNVLVVSTGHKDTDRNMEHLYIGGGGGESDDVFSSFPCLALQRLNACVECAGCLLK